MGFLQRMIKSTYRDETAQRSRSSFANLSEQQLEEHLAIARYGSFLLTDAVRPSFNLDVVPSAGFRRDSYKDPDTGVTVPVLMAAASRERLFELFIDLLDPLGEVVDVVLETSHDTSSNGHRDLTREQIDLPILKSTLYDYEDLLLDDGCTGIAVLNPRIPLEVQFDEHKLLVMYGRDLEPFEEVLGDYRLRHSDTIRFITEGEHVHSSTEEMAERFEEMACRLSVEND
ncbi:MAG: hypothetical protein ACK5Q5_13815 [Planctomycetaceae bacterium]